MRSGRKRLENGDTLQVPPIGPHVTVDGMVRRPAVYELANETSPAEVLELACGILPAAALCHIVQRVEAHEKRTLDLTSTDSQEVNQQLQAFQIQDGNQAHIFPIAAYNEDAIFLQGHVLRPALLVQARDEIDESDLVDGDVLPEPAAHYAEIIRLNALDFHPGLREFRHLCRSGESRGCAQAQAANTVRIFQPI